MFVLSWQLTGNSTPVVGGSWIVALYSDDMDGQGLMNGLIAGPDIVPITGGISPLKFQHKFTVSPPKPQVGLYQLTAVITHSPSGRPEEALGDVRLRRVHSHHDRQDNGGDQLTSATRLPPAAAASASPPGTRAVPRRLAPPAASRSPGSGARSLGVRSAGSAAQMRCRRRAMGLSVPARARR